MRYTNRLKGLFITYYILHNTDTMENVTSTETMTLHLKKFDMSQIRERAAVVFIGPRATSKTTTIIDCLRYHCDIPNGLVYSFDKAFEQICPESILHIGEYSEETVNAFVENQKDKRDTPAFLVLDACFHDTKWTKHQAIKTVFMNGRNFNIFSIIAMSYDALPVTMRTNCDYVFITKTDSVSDREKLYKNYAGIFPTLSVFNVAMDQIQTHEFLVLNYRTKSNTIEDIVSWYKADPKIDFRLCSASATVSL